MKTRLVLWLLLLLSVQVIASGGGRTSGGERRSSSRSSSYNSYSRSRSNDYDYGYNYNSHSYSYDYGGVGGPLPTWAYPIIILIVIVALMCCCSCFSSNNERVTVVKTEGGGFNRTLSYEGSIPCYLCLSEVSNSSWDSGEHRKMCFFTNQRELLSYPQPYESFCPNCHERLRLWPEKGHPFYCDQCPFDQRGLKISTGENRLNCFLCDFDCCVNCVNEGKMQRRLSLENIESGGFRRTLSYKQPNTERAGTPPYNQYNPAPFPAEYHAYANPAEYNDYVSRTFPPPSPNQPPSAPSDHPSYTLQLTQQHQGTESNTPWVPSAPPLINNV